MLPLMNLYNIEYIAFTVTAQTKVRLKSIRSFFSPLCPLPLILGLHLPSPCSSFSIKVLVGLPVECPIHALIRVPVKVPV